MRELKTKDVFAMSRILKKMDLKLDVNGKTQEQVGAESLLAIFANIHLAEQELTGFLADLNGMTAEQLADKPFGELKAILGELFAHSGIEDFFKSAGALTR